MADRSQAQIVKQVSLRKGSCKREVFRKGKQKRDGTLSRGRKSERAQKSKERGGHHGNCSHNELTLQYCIQDTTLSCTATYCM
jgi:hypothetical protein